VKVGGPERLVHYTPLRYPGGKGKLASYVKSIIELNNLGDCDYVEPYAGGAGIALELLFHEYAARIHINDISRSIYCFWDAVLNNTETLIKRIRDIPVSVASWDQQKLVLLNPQNYDRSDIAFSTFFLNRTNRSGILNGGIIGGREQNGPWKIDARYNSKELIRRIESIAAFRGRISLSRLDAKVFLAQSAKTLAPNTLIYLDPPYYAKGKDLYYDYYGHDDHAAVAETVRSRIKKQSWIVSYDNVEPIRRMYAGYPSREYTLGYSARDARRGNEIMFFAESLTIPNLGGVMKQIAHTERN